MSDKVIMKKSYRSKTTVTQCGYCSMTLNEENLQNHCKTVHNKPKFSAGQRTIKGLFRKLTVNQEFQYNETEMESSTAVNDDPL